MLTKKKVTEAEQKHRITTIESKWEKSDTKLRMIRGMNARRVITE